MSPAEEEREAKAVEVRTGRSVYSMGSSSVERPVRRISSADRPLQCL